MILPPAAPFDLAFKAAYERERDQKQKWNENKMKGNYNWLHNCQANHLGCSCQTIRAETINSTDVKGLFW